MPSFPIDWAGAFLADFYAGDNDTPRTYYYVITDQYFWSVGPARYATVTDNGDNTLNVSVELVFPNKCTVSNSVWHNWPYVVMGISIQPENGTYRIIPPSSDTVAIDTDHGNAAWRGQFQSDNGNLWNMFLGWDDFGSSLHYYIFATGNQVNMAQSGAILPAGNLNIWNPYEVPPSLLTRRETTGSTSERGYWEMTINVTVSGRIELIPPPFSLDHVEFFGNDTAIVYYTYNNVESKCLFKRGNGFWWPIDNSLFGIMKTDARYKYLNANNATYNLEMISQDLGIFNARS